MPADRASSTTSTDTESSTVSCPGTRGCIFFHFGDGYALRLLVSIFTLREVYDGPITVFLLAQEAGGHLQHQLNRDLRCDVRYLDHITKSWDRHRLFTESPYDSTLCFDSDLIIVAGIDDIWEPLEREGVLVTRFHCPPYGVDGTAERPGWANRVQMLKNIRGLVDAEIHAEAVRRMLEDRIDVNIGVMGVSRPRGNAFLEDWGERIEHGRTARYPLLDEMLTVALLPKHRHLFADEKWNCPADEFFRCTNLADARVIHYFADGHRVLNMRLGRNPSTWAGKKWYSAYHRAARKLDLRRWARADRKFSGRFKRLLSYGFPDATRLVVETVGRKCRKMRKEATDRVKCAWNNCFRAR